MGILLLRKSEFSDAATSVANPRGGDHRYAIAATSISNLFKVSDELFKCEIAGSVPVTVINLLQVLVPAGGLEPPDANVVKRCLYDCRSTF
jgi:hypothetical protein